MKNLRKITALLTFCILAFSMNAQEADQKTAQDKLSIIKFNTLGVFGGQYQFAYERVIKPKLSLQLSAGLLAGSSNASVSISGNNYKYDNTRQGIIIVPEVRFYPNGNAGKGLFFSGFGRFRNVKKDLTDYSSGDSGIEQNLSRERVTTTIGGGGTIGYQWIKSNGLSFDIFVGVGYKTRKSTNTYDKASLNEASAIKDFDSIGDELFSQKYINLPLNDTEKWSPRFGLHLGYAF
ncbi:MAG: DUF3575 domain-containing protein [Saprospiraceae bacterium]